MISLKTLGQSPLLPQTDEVTRSAFFGWKPLVVSSQRSGGMNDMCWPLLPCCCGALLSWSATTRRAQQRLRRCNFGELDKLPFFYEGNLQPTGSPCWSRFRCSDPCVGVLSVKRGFVWRWDYFISLSFPLVCLRVDDRVFGSRRWARLRCLAGEDKGVESRPAVPPLPVGPAWKSCKPPLSY